MRPARLIALTVAAAALLYGLPAATGAFDTPHASRTDGAAATAATAPAETSGSNGSNGSAAPLDAVARAEARLREAPDDPRALAQLGGAYVERARAGGDPTFYPRAHQALERALHLSPPGAPAREPALVGLAALANARHDFATGRDLARQAIAENAYSAPAFGALTDALTQLGDAAGATDAVQRMLDLKPGIPSFTRASYDLELRGDTDGARLALERALSAASTADEVAYCRRYLGELARGLGDPVTALAHYDAGLTAAPDDPALRAGHAAALAALGRHDTALAEYADVTTALPAPQFLIDYGELLEAMGRADEAHTQYELATAQFALMEASGASDDLARALFEADHGDPSEAVRRAEAEWGRRQSVHTADALAWALFRAGRAAEALPYARRATAGGWRDPEVVHHLTMIQEAAA